MKRFFPGNRPSDVVVAGRVARSRQSDTPVQSVVVRGSHRESERVKASVSGDGPSQPMQSIGKTPEHNNGTSFDIEETVLVPPCSQSSRAF